MKSCPCGSQNRYLDCCGAYLKRISIPKTPEALMRSRYAAFVEGDLNYIKKTMRPPASLNFNKKNNQDDREWVGLEVIQAWLDSNTPTVGYVEFKASYRLNKVFYTIHEQSEFHLINGKWYYISGQQF